MDNAIHVQAQAEGGEENIYGQIDRVQVDLMHANALLGSMINLDGNHDWNIFKSKLIDPTKETVEKQIKSLVKELRSNQALASEIIYQQAFLDVLKLITDFPKLKKKYDGEVKLLQGRLKQLESKAKGKNA